MKLDINKGSSFKQALEDQVFNSDVGDIYNAAKSHVESCAHVAHVAKMRQLKEQRQYQLKKVREHNRVRAEAEVRRRPATVSTRRSRGTPCRRCRSTRAGCWSKGVRGKCQN